MPHLTKATRTCIRRLIERQGFVARPVPRPLIEHPSREMRIALEYVVARHMMDRGQRFVFLQIGAFDGQHGDPIHGFVKKYAWQGILVEPQARYFEALSRTYDGYKGLILKNA